MIFGAAGGICPLYAQTRSFFREFRTPQIDRASAIAADATGVYVFGTKTDNGGGRGTAGVYKYDSAGNELWTRDFNAPASGTIIFLGAAAEPTVVYVLAGLGDFARLFVRKYSPQGNELWTRDMGFSAPGALAVDATGVYVVGRDFPPVSSYLRKYSTDGTEIFTTKFGDTQATQNPHALVVDSTGIYLYGIGVPAVGSFFRKYTLGGTELWTRVFGAQPVPTTLAAALPTGFFVVNFNSDENAGLLHKYDSDGIEVWSRSLPSGTVGEVIVADSTGVYVAGTTSLGLPGQCRSGAGSDSFVMKYDTAGVEQWTREYGPSDSALATAVALDSSGVYVAGVSGPFGYRVYDFLPPNERTNRAFVARFDKTQAPVTLTPPRIFPDCIVNAASYVGGGVAPGEIVTIFGSGIGPSQGATLQLTQNGRVSTTLSATRILFNGVPAPLLYVSDKQSNAIVPYAIAGAASVEVRVEYQGVQSQTETVPVLPSRPGVFSVNSSGRGQAAILNEDGTLNSPANPAARGSIIMIFGTGGGEAAAGVSEDQIVGDTSPRTALPVTVSFDIGDEVITPKQGEVLYAGGSRGSVVGLLQVNVRVPTDAVIAFGMANFALTIGSQWEAFQVSVALR